METGLSARPAGSVRYQPAGRTVLRGLRLVPGRLPALRPHLVCKTTAQRSCLGLFVVQFAFSSSRGCWPSLRGNGDTLRLPWAEPAEEAASRVEGSCSAEGVPHSGASFSRSDARRGTGDCPVLLGSSHHRSPDLLVRGHGGKNPPSKVHTEVSVRVAGCSRASPLLVDPVLPGSRLLQTLTRALSGADPAGLSSFPRRWVHGKQELVTCRCVLL